MPTNLRSKTPVGVVQKFYGLLIAYNAVRQLMQQAARSANIEPRQLSFIHALRIIGETIPIMRAARTEQLPFVYSCMIQHIATGRLPPPRDRINPRVVKVKRSNFAKRGRNMTTDHKPKNRLSKPWQSLSERYWG